MKKNLTSLSDFIDQEIGIKGTKNRAKFDKDSQTFKSEILTQQMAGKIQLPKNGISKS